MMNEFVFTTVKGLVIAGKVNEKDVPAVAAFLNPLLIVIVLLTLFIEKLGVEGKFI